MYIKRCIICIIVQLLLYQISILINVLINMYVTVLYYNNFY